MMGYFRDLVAARRGEPADDLLSALISARDGGDGQTEMKLSENELLSMAWLLLVAGHETTVNLIGGGVLALLQDPSRYAGPEELDVGRDSTGHLAFGHGIHYCVGAPLARLEAEIAFGTLLRRFGSITLAVPPSELRWRPSSLIHGLERLPVRLG